MKTLNLNVPTEITTQEETIKSIAIVAITAPDVMNDRIMNTIANRMSTELLTAYNDIRDLVEIIGKTKEMMKRIDKYSKMSDREMMTRINYALVTMCGVFTTIDDEGVVYDRWQNIAIKSGSNVITLETRA